MLYLNFIIHNKRKKHKRRLGNCPYLNAYKTATVDVFIGLENTLPGEGLVF